MNKRKVLITFSVILILVTIIIVGFLLSKRETPPPSPFSTEDRLPKTINPQGDTILFRTSNYEIAFLPAFQKYVISITGSPFEAYRQEAETTFLQVLGISQQSACTLTVSISTPYFANPDESGKEYRLSFCTTASPTPTLTIDPSLSPLTIIKITPVEGFVEIGKTKNSIFVAFNQPIDPNTAVVLITPEISHITQVHIRNPNELIIVPTDLWQSNISYTVSVKAGLRSKDGQFQLKQDVILHYQTIEYVPPGFHEGI